MLLSDDCRRARLAERDACQQGIRLAPNMTSSWNRTGSKEIVIDFRARKPRVATRARSRRILQSWELSQFLLFSAISLPALNLAH